MAGSFNIHQRECDRNKLCCHQKHAKIIFSHLLSAAPVISEQTGFLSSHLINRHHKQLININMTGVDWMSLLQTIIKARSGIQTLANTQSHRSSDVASLKLLSLPQILAMKLAC